MRSVIRVRYAAPTDHRGARLIARSPDLPSVITPYDYSVPINENHKAAAKKFAEKVDWPFRRYVGGWYGHDSYWVDTLELD